MLPIEDTTPFSRPRRPGCKPGLMNPHWSPRASPLVGLRGWWVGFGERQAELGRRQAELGHQQRAAADAAHQRIMRLLEEAAAAGQAQPVK